MTVRRRPRGISYLLWAGALLSLAASSPPGPAAPSPALRILSDRVLPPGLDKTFDVRWASDRTIYLPLLRDGTVEAAVDSAGPSPREMIPGAKTVGGWRASSRVAASSTYLVVAGTAGPFGGLTWRTLDKAVRSEQAFEVVESIDVAADRLLVLGVRRDDQRKVAPDGTIAWIGSLDQGLSDLRAVLSDASGPGARNMLNCLRFGMGGVRFLAGGSFIVVPGVQPGAYLYDASAKLIRTWDTVGLGIDSDCASITETQSSKLATDFDARVAWLNSRRTLDDILPLPQGPGLVIRSVNDGRVHWQLKVLRQSGGAATYEIPIAADSTRSHLRGDVRGGTVVFLASSYQDHMGSMHRPASRLIIAEVPSH